MSVVTGKVTSDCNWNGIKEPGNVEKGVVIVMASLPLIEFSDARAVVEHWSTFYKGLSYIMFSQDTVLLLTMFVL